MLPVISIVVLHPRKDEPHSGYTHRMPAFDNESLSDVTLAILAGGAGSRMGMPKGQLILNGRPILEYLLDHLDWPGAPCW